MANQIGNEKLKLTCTWINGMSLAIFAAGVVLPIISFITGNTQSGLGATALLCVICFAITVSVHLSAKSLLGEFDDSD